MPIFNILIDFLHKLLKESHFWSQGPLRPPHAVTRVENFQILCEPSYSSCKNWPLCQFLTFESIFFTSNYKILILGPRGPWGCPMTSQGLKIFTFYADHRIPRVKIGLCASFQLFDRFSSQDIKMSS